MVAYDVAKFRALAGTVTATDCAQPDRLLLGTGSSCHGHEGRHVNRPLSRAHDHSLVPRVLFLGVRGTDGLARRRFAVAQTRGCEVSKRNCI
jgi:hypothetical protein